MSEMNKCTACSYIISGICADCERKNLIITLERQLAEAREEFSKLVDHMGYFSQRELANQIGKVHRKLKEQG